MLQIECHRDAHRFRRAVAAYLRANIISCNQLHTIVQGLDQGQVAQRHSWLARLHRDGETVGVALIHSTLPLRSLVVSELDRAGADLVAAALAQDSVSVSDVIGTPASVAALLAALSPPPQTRLRARLGNHVLENLATIPTTAGAWRAAGAADVDLLADWESAFLRECGFPPAGAFLRNEIRQRLDAPAVRYRLWEIDGRPAAMAVGRLAPPAARVGPVYTTPTLRGRGCAGALVAHLCRELMDSGARTVSLFTDLANPISNGVYRRLGFICVGELLHLDLLPAATAATAFTAAMADTGGAAAKASGPGRTGATN